MPLAKKLNSTLDVDIVIPDLRGHGCSAPGNLGDIDYLGQFEFDLSDLYEHLIDEFLLLALYLGYQTPAGRCNSGGWAQVAQLRYPGSVS